jgi:2-amino-4-hydroxy-6-hydroxymethyldihydropteridine diphosphokinase
MTLVYIGLGSNLDSPSQQLIQAIHAIAKLPQVSISAVSSLYGSRPMGPQDQPDYINAVLALTTELSALKLLDALQKIELDAGRERKDERWGARVLDLDILLFGQEIINSERLIVPHYGLKEREFVLLPLAEIAPDLSLPSGENITILATNIARNGLAIKQSISLSDIVNT